MNPPTLWDPASVNLYCWVGLTTGTLPPWGIPLSIESELRSGIDPWNPMHSAAFGLSKKHLEILC